MSCSRRQFLGHAAGCAAVVGLSRSVPDAAAAPKPAAAAAPLGTVIDTHTHFYDPRRPGGVPWPPASDPLLYRTVLPEHYRALPVPRPVTGTVVVEASPLVEDNQWILDLASRDPFIVGFVGNLPLGTKEFEGHLKRFSVNPIFRGIRSRDRKLDGTLEDAAFLRDLRLLAGAGLSLDLVGGLEILSFAGELARKVPDLRIVVDHLAGLAVDGKSPPASWLEAMKALTPRAQVFFKVSGLVEGTGRTQGDASGEVAFYRPVLDALWDLFGPERLIYGSNWPVSERFAPLATVQGIVETYFRGRGSEALEQVFWRSGQAAYRWRARAQG